MKKKLSFETGLILFLLLTAAIVVTSGVLAYQSLMRLNDVMVQSTKPKLKLVYLKGIVAHIASAESNVKSFALTSDEEYLTAYATSTQSLESSLAQLDSLTADNFVQHNKVDSIRLLLKSKLNYLEDYVQLGNRRLITNELNALARKIEEGKQKIKAAKQQELKEQEEKKREEATKKKKGLFKRIFTKKKAPGEEKMAEVIALKKLEDQYTKELRTLDEVKKEVGLVKEKQSNKLLQIDNEELSLTQESKLLSDRIQTLITKLEIIEINTSQQMVLDGEKKHKTTNFLITFFSITASVLLLSIAWLVIIYLKKRKEYELGLMHAKSAAENYSMLQEVFLANMSHEVRTPMNAISGFTDQVLQTKLQEQQRSYLEIVKKSIRHLLVILDDILDYSKLKAGKIRIEETDFNVREVVNDVVTLMQENARQKQTELLLQMQDKLPEALVGDPLRLKQILVNLLSNAIKFAPAGKVVLKVEYKHTNAQTGNLLIEVMDNGIGISRENLKRIFEAFEQAESSTTRKFGGSGLGLAITQKLVVLQDGQIRMESEEGKGSTVYVSIPCTIGNPSAIAPQLHQVVDTDLLKNASILIADDDEWNTKLLQAILHKFGLHAHAVSNGVEALNYIENNNCDLVLMDIRMPVLDGIEASRQLRKHPSQNKSSLPIIILTAAADDRQLALCREAGVNAILTKPFSEEKLLHIIAEALSHSFIVPEKAEAEILLPEPATAEKNGSSASYNLVHLQKLANNDEKFLYDMILTFIKNLQNTITHITMASDKGNWDVVQEQAHKICPQCRYLEANNLVALFKETEKNAVEKNVVQLHSLIQKINTEATQIITSLEKELKD